MSTALDCPLDQMLASDSWKRIDEMEEKLRTLPQVRPPLRHVFTPGLYVRECILEKGCLFTTRIHLTDHPFVISSGAVAIWTLETGWVRYLAPHTGVTKPHTRRVLFALEDTTFSTFHVTNETDPDVIGRQITYCGGRFEELGLAQTNPKDAFLK